MKTNWILRAARWGWRWRWLLLMNLFLLSPVLLYELRIGEGGPDKTILFILGASVLWLATVQLLARRLWVTHALMFPLYVVVATDLYVIADFRTRLSSSMLLTIFENLEDGRAYFQTHAKGIVLGVAALLAGYALAMVRIRKLRTGVSRKAALLPLGALVALYIGVHHVLGLWMWVATNDRNSPFGIFPQAFTSLTLYEGSLRDARQAQGFSFHAVRPHPPAEPETYVLVIGESSRAMDWQLYGYSRPTNPTLEKTPDLLVFQDVITQAAVTRRSVPLILTRGTIEDEQRTARERSIVSVFGEGGFETYWLSTQERDPFTGAINRYPREADVTRFYERRYDETLVDSMRELLADDKGHPKRFFVVHTLGSHFTLTSRYPRTFARFPDEDPNLGSRQLLVNQYDDTIVYTDHVLTDFIALLQQQPGIKALFFVADHGENLRDDARNLYGHYMNNEYDLPIPMMFWYSPEFAAAFPEKVAAAEHNLSRPLNTRVVFYSLADMAGFDVHDPQLPRLSVFSDAFTPYDRMVMGDPKPFDFDRSPLKAKVQRERQSATMVGTAAAP